MSWKITRLYLKNNRFIYSGMNKYEIDIDFTKANKNSKLNLLIGPIGSGKTAIIAQLQPFATVGTLDNRSSVDQTIEEMDGCKIIEYDHNGNHYKIQHDFIWNKNMKSHMTKSYLIKNDKELNSNGNSGSFKELIKLEFGIDQSYLRLLRLGTNVETLIKLKPVERKKFIASLREDTEIYIMLHKKLTEDFRTLNASINSVSNRLMQLSATDEDKMKNELEAINEKMNELSSKMKNNENKIGNLQGINSTIGELSELTNLFSLLETEIDSKKLKIEQLKSEVNAANTEETLESISNKIGITQGVINSIEDRLTKSDIELNSLQTEINKHNDIIAISENRQHMDDMRRILSELENNYNRYSAILAGFTYKYTYNFLRQFIDNLSVFQSMLDELGQVNHDTLKYIFNHLNQSINVTINDKVNTLIGKRVNLQKALSTVEYSKDYIEPVPLFTPPFCPTKQCPYYTSHPNTIKKRSGNKKDINAKLLRLQDEITRLDNEIVKYQEYPFIQKKLQLLQNQWKSNLEVLSTLGLIDNTLSLFDLLTNQMKRRNWYNYKELINILEKSRMQEDFNDVSNRYFSVKNEIEKLKSPEYESSKYKLEMVLQRKDELTKLMKDDTSEIQMHKESMDRLEGLYHVIQHKDENQSILNEEIKRLKEYVERIEITENNINKLKFNQEEIRLLSDKLNKQSSEYRELQIQSEKLKNILNQIAYNQEEYNSLMQDRTVLKSILDAVSSKEGIPLILVKVFLDNCKEIINDLIADVFEDDLEILDFNISETDFKIPYMVNGQYIDDIEYASQGQTSIISIALSFALVQQSIFDYNIMLLDEVDGPLHFSDREKFIGILFKQMAAIHSDQVFMISHSEGIFEGNPINIIMTNDEHIESTNKQVIIKV